MMNRATQPQPFHVHVVDDDAALRTALSRLLLALGFAVSLYDSAAAFLAAPTDTLTGCILLDVNMPEVSGLQLQEELRQRGRKMPVIFLTGHGDVAMSVRAVKAGAEDFLLKPVSREALLDALERARARAANLQIADDAARDLRERLASLTPREREVFALVAQGLLNKQIAYQLGNTERTVKAQRGSVMEKMQVGSVAELVLAAARLGLVGPGTSL
jgi:FixJ family two-component response regulator